MNESIAFVGDVHGEVAALDALLRAVEARGVKDVVLLGDYINKGPESAAVVELLASRQSEHPRLIALLGNHELAFLECLDSGDVRPLLRMGGAPTILSYTRQLVGPDVFADLAAAVPPHHMDFLRGLDRQYDGEGVIARHQPAANDGRYQISAHVDVGRSPRIGSRDAAIDTGCGSRDGRLTALMWPTLDWIQVDVRGEAIS